MRARPTPLALVLSILVTLGAGAFAGCGGPSGQLSNTADDGPGTGTRRGSDSGSGFAGDGQTTAEAGAEEDSGGRPTDSGSGSKPKDAQASDAKASDTGSSAPVDSGVAAACSKTGSSWLSGSTAADAYNYKNFGHYNVANDDWGYMANQETWANSASCWGVSAPSATVASCCVGAYPSVSRGWIHNQTMMDALSSSGTSDWTTKSGMGILVGDLTKTKIHWAFDPPTTSENGLAPRWMALQDIYFHQTNDPDYSKFPPYTDLMIDQAIADQALSSGTYYGLVASESNAFTITVGGGTFLVYVDNSGEASFHSGGHNIHLFQQPTSVSDPATGILWGVYSNTLDLKAVIDYFRQSNIKDDNGKPVKNSAGDTITAPLLTDDLYLNAINAGFEIDQGTKYQVNNFWVAMQGEADGPSSP